MAEEQEVAQVEQSTVLTEEEVASTIEGQPLQEEPTTTLPSDSEAFVVPDKFKGKSAEEIAKAYVELEKMKGGDSISQPEPATKEAEDGGNEGTKLKLDDYYVSFMEKGELTPEQYTELEKAGMTKETVDEQMDFYQYKVEKAQREVLGDTTIDTFNAAALKAREAWGDDVAEEWNTTLANAPLGVQKVMVSNLVSQFSNAEAPSQDTVLHTNTPQYSKQNGYANRSELLKDMQDQRYDSDKSYNKAVQEKLARSDTSSW